MSVSIPGNVVKTGSGGAGSASGRGTHYLFPAGAALTPIMGLLSERFQSIAVAYSVPLIAYIVIALYSFFGARERGLQAA
jgi:fucose permease